MRKRAFVLALATVMLLSVFVPHVASEWSDEVPASVNRTEIAIPQTNSHGLFFTKNVGQWDDRVLYRASSGGATIWLTREGIFCQSTHYVVSDLSETPWAETHPPMMGRVQMRDYPKAGADINETAIVYARFTDPSPTLIVEADGQLDHKCNYFLGNDPSQWRSDVPNYSSVIYRDVYSGVDLRLEGGLHSEFKIAWTARSEADLAQVAFSYESNADARESKMGELRVETPWDSVVHLSLRPQGHPKRNDERFTSGTAVVADGSTSATVVYSTYLGGSDDEDGQSIAVDSEGNAYVAGYVVSTDFPTTNPYQTDQGLYDAFVTKLSSDGTTPIYSTYLGGDDHDWIRDLSIGESGNIYVTGWTASANFPMVGPIQTDQGTWDAFVTKISAAGNALVYSTYLGGSSDDRGSGIVVDTDGSAFITGWTASTNFPLALPLQSDRGGWDAFATKLNPTGDALVFSTYLGGSGDDWGISLAVDTAGNTYVAGATESADFPTVNPYQTDQADRDAYVAILDPNGNALLYSTYLGGEDLDWANAIVVDPNGSAYVAGETHSADFPTVEPYQEFLRGARDAFVAKLYAGIEPPVYSTLLGGTGDDWANDVVVDSDGNALITGCTGSSDFPIIDPVQMNQGGNDAYVARLAADGSKLLFSTYLGGGDYDEARGIAVHEDAQVFLTGGTTSLDFPTVNQYQENRGNDDAFLTKLALAYCECPHQGDFDANAVLDAADLNGEIDALFFGGINPQDPACPTTRADFNADGFPDAVDLNELIDHLFFGGPAPADPCAP